ncbi:MAG: hypothetical protein KGZ79_09390 [Dethiobacter sp.]|jgi:hypothetical protein|nr:hypothetical protein [Dethiobacter sp.]
MCIVRLPWGREATLDVPLPGEWKFRAELLPYPFEPVTDVKEAVVQGLQDSIDAVPLSDMSLAGKKVVSGMCRYGHHCRHASNGRLRLEVFQCRQPGGKLPDTI